LGLYLTNTIEAAMQRTDMLFARSISDEANAAARIKQEYPVMVVMGNPPYSGHSANKGEWIKQLLHGMDSRTGKKTGNYFEVDGHSLDERNPKWLNDDYVKFIRFAQWRIEQTGYGVLAFITNHGYLDNPTFRGMRQSLMQSFDEIYVLDLHGNSKKKERSPDGSKDENVFDIQQGVAIGIFVRKQRKTNEPRQATVYHAHLWGQREIYEKASQRLVGGKYYWLTENSLSTTQWKWLKPEKPSYLFIPQDNDLRIEYEMGNSIIDIMPINAIGMNSHRDYFAIAFDALTLKERIQDLVSTHLNDDDIVSKYGLTNTPDFKLSRARNALRKATKLDQIIVPCLYRPFDQRVVLYHTEILDRPRTEINYHFVNKDNIGLVTTRQTREPFAVLATNRVCGQHKIVATYDGSSIFPLYLYPDPNKKNLFDTNIRSDAPDGRYSNLSPKFISDISNKLTMQFIQDGTGDLHQTFGPEDIFTYMYAIFHAPAYRERYAEFLKIDFPRLPLTSNAELFRELCKLGKRLVKLHLMEGEGEELASYPQKGNNVVDVVKYTEPGQGWDRGRVWINKEQYFEGVALDVWEFHVGGYQVCQKWLKDRKGRVLSYEDIEHYARIVANLVETIGLMGQIDAVIDEHGGWPIG
jgi:predicted helicase